MLDCAHPGWDKQERQVLQQDIGCVVQLRWERQAQAHEQEEQKHADDRPRQGKSGPAHEGLSGDLASQDQRESRKHVATPRLLHGRLSLARMSLSTP